MLKAINKFKDLFIVNFNVFIIALMTLKAMKTYSSFWMVWYCLQNAASNSKKNNPNEIT